jgi:hypothetical protein
MCVNYHGLNWLTIKNQYLLHLILRLLKQLNHVKVYIETNLCGTYLVRIWKGNEWKTMFKTHYNHFEYVVMPFGINKAHVFQHPMNNVFH